MKTITFYSYKGGVGRTLALSNIAKRLNEFGKKVFIIDFDLEAPGVHYKFKDFVLRDSVKQGLVDYIYKFYSEGLVDEDLSKYVKSFIVNIRNRNAINLMCAGNSTSSQYWKKLSSINWGDMFYQEESEGVEFFLNLKEAIRERYDPDYLLIDSRTGYTETSAITMSILADEVMVFSANNLENIEGSKQIIKSIKRTKSISGNNIKTHFVLTRIPGGNSPEEKTIKNKIVAQVYYQLNSGNDSKEKLVDEIYLIHTDRDLEIEESFKITGDFKPDSVSISNDYFKILKVIANFSQEELESYNSILKSDEVYSKAMKLPRDKAFENELKYALKLNKNNVDVLRELAIYYYENLQKEEEISVLRRAIRIEPKNPTLLSHLGYALVLLYHLSDNYDLGVEGLGYLKKAVATEKDNNRINVFVEVLYCQGLKMVHKLSHEEVESLFQDLLNRFPNSQMVYNSMAVNFQEAGDLASAYNYVYKALEQDSGNATFMTTLAEISAKDNKENEFYYNLDLALKTKYGIEGFFYYHEFYSKYFTNERFLRLLDKYNVLAKFNKLLKRYNTLVGSSS
ncbi:KGGVGR-motif variant AAA ATPase [uncultured Draconibacterium sp.]|uniref:KGGVGR-motif variant AAA ATPase n=1 Tax=uncultured Draconibacterium sp. TaxID=1573823 RepID=UPI0029C99335|nr:AAA family ATPase [uncultured Draconibacterium sp.]